MTDKIQNYKIEKINIYKIKEGEKREMKTKDSRAGITLIALVISIIVILILGGVSIAMLMGDNSLLGRAQSTIYENEFAEARDNVGLAYNAAYADYLSEYYAKGKTGVTKTIIEYALEKIVDEPGKYTVEKPDAITETGNQKTATVTVRSFSDKNKTRQFTITEDLISNTANKASLVWENSPTVTPPTIVVDESSVKITKEDGSAITKGEVPANTKLKINFTASVEGGTVTISPSVEHTTTPEEMTAKKVTFTISGNVPGKTVEPLTYTVDLKDVYENTDLDVAKVKRKATSLYGSEVRGYTCEGTGVDKWRIFYADGEDVDEDDRHIYLIADDYLAVNDAPKGKNGTAVYKNSSDYKLSFNDVYKDYTGSAWILQNSRASKWLNKYFNYTDGEGNTPNKISTNPNIRAVAFMMDTSANVWGKWANNNLAEYAIGGPTLEMYVNSYKDTHPSSNISCSVTGTNGYSYSNASTLSSTDNCSIYIKSGTNKASAMWLASPSSNGNDSIVNAYCTGNLFYGRYYGNNTGLRPLVCLKSNVQLEKIEDGVYKIKTE